MQHGREVEKNLSRAKTLVDHSAFCCFRRLIVISEKAFLISLHGKLIRVVRFGFMNWQVTEP